MSAINRTGTLLIITALSFAGYAHRQQTVRKNIVVIKGIRSAAQPFAAIKAPAWEIKNDRLNISVTDRQGNMLQINGVDIKNLHNTILPRSEFQTVIIWALGQTTTDDADDNRKSILEIRCENANPGSPITVGLKTTILQNDKKHRVYATLSGVIPSYQYQRTN